MNGRPFYELEGGGEDVYLYYYHDGKKNRYWLISKYVRIDQKNFRNFAKIFKIFQKNSNIFVHIARCGLHFFARFHCYFTNCLFLSRLMFYPCSDIVLKN